MKWILVILLAGASANAQTTEQDPLFTKPRRGRLVQLVLSLAEASGAALLYPKKTPRLSRSHFEELAARLSEVFERPFDESHRLSLLTDINRHYVGAPLSHALEERLKRISTAPLIGDAQRTALVVDLLEAEMSRLHSHAPRTLRILQMAGAVLLVADILARLYVWQALHADPTYSPVATYLLD